MSSKLAARLLWATSRRFVLGKPQKVVARMAVWKLEDFMSEFDTMEELHKRRPDSVLVPGLWSSVASKLTSVPNWRAHDVMQLMDKLEGINLPEDLKKNIQETLDSLVSTNLGHMRLVAGAQTVEDLPPYLSKDDWSSLAECTVTNDALVLIATRLRKLGVVHLKEGTKRQVMALLFWWYKDNTPGPWPLYHMCQEFVRIFATLQVPCHAPSQSVYPANPMSMGSVWLSQAYGSEEKPALNHLVLQPYFAKIPLRSTSALLVTKAMPQATGGSTPTANSSVLPTAENPGATDRLTLALEKFIDKWQSPAPEAARVPLSDVMQPKAIATVAPSAVQSLPSTVAAQPMVPLPAAEPQLADPAALEAFEEKAMEMIVAKKEGRSKNNASLKRPAAAPSVQKQKEKKVKKHNVGEVFGCLRCRGNVRGCDTCRNPQFQGRRFGSRSEWNAFMETKKQRHG